MTTPNDIIQWVEELKGSTINHEEGIHHGSSDLDIGGVTVCWKATPGAIEAAGQRGDNLIIGHESLYYPYYFDFDPDRTPGWEDWSINKMRKGLLEDHGLTFLRLHSSIDVLVIIKDMGRWLELGVPTKAENGATVWEMSECTLGELVAKVKRLSGIPAIRVSRPKNKDMNTKVKRVGLLPGGGALCPNGGVFEPGTNAGVDVFVAGETDNYGFRRASECGIPLIETSHEVCENPGFRHFAEMLAERFANLSVIFYENTCPYEIV